MARSSFLDELTPKHVRAARALLAWSQKDLAEAAGVATSTIADFERGKRTPVANNAEAIRTALEGADVRFLPTGAVTGPPVQIVAERDKSGMPIRWVSAEDLSEWANRIDGAISLPTLLDFLIRATHGPGVRVRFPSDEAVRLEGWDGQTSAERGSDYVPIGDAGWEIGTQRSNIPQKAGEDYRKRTAKPAPLDPASASYIFVTPRHWPKKAEWAKARQKEGPWRDVRVYDADDLVHWIEQTPAVGLWLATRLGKRPDGTRELDEAWEEWSQATRWPLTEDLVLSSRDEDATEVLRWLRGRPAVLSLQATTADEVVAFFHAALCELPDELRDAYRARCLVTTTAAAARNLAAAPAPLFLLLTEPDPGLASSLAKRGHYVLQAYDERHVSEGDVRILQRPSREAIADALVAAGIEETAARKFARDSARNLAVLRRLIPSAPGRLPSWAEGSPPRQLLAALLACGWDEAKEGDRARLAELAGQPYDDLVAALVPHVGQFDSPLQKIGSTWSMASPSDAWTLLARHLTTSDIARFEAVAQSVLGAADPRFDMVSDERWLASVKGVHQTYSSLLRHGIGQVLILLALSGDRILTVPDAQRRADAIVAELLDGADARRWWSLSRDFRLLGEASPGAFLTAIENSLDQNDPPIGALFERDEGGFIGEEHLADLMWALEALAWSPDLMGRVTHVVARLDAIDVKPRRQVNGPRNSLRELHLLWNPQTFATLDERLRALDLICKHEPDSAWRLMLGILPQGHDTATPSNMPRWRDYTVDQVETVTWDLIRRGTFEITSRLVEKAGLGPARWSSLLNRLGDLSPDPDSALDALDAAEPRITDRADRTAIWDTIRGVLHHHRQVPDADWSLPSAVLERLDALYNRFAPADPAERTAWLFQPSARLPRPSAPGWEVERSDLEAARREAARTLYDTGGISAVLGLARLSEAAFSIGKALYDSGLPPSEVNALLGATLRSEDPRERDVGCGLIFSAYAPHRETWAEALITRATSEGWGDAAHLAIFIALPVERWTWDRVAEIGGEVEKAYWRKTNALQVRKPEDVAHATRMMIRVGRARQALPFAALSREVHLPTELLVEVLRETARQPVVGDADHNEAGMFQYYVAEAFGLLDQRNDVDRDALVALEWAYLRVLERSRRPVKLLLRALSEQPALFVEVLSAVYKPSEDSGIVDPEPSDPEQARNIAGRAYRLLSEWDRLPGTREDSTVDVHALESWIKEARARAKGVGRAEIADYRIGTMLSAPRQLGNDGAWPIEPVREMLDLFRSKSMLDGFQIGKANRRGVTSRAPGDGGALERQEAAKYRAWAKAIEYEHPRTAKALDSLAAQYEREAKQHDDDVERRDWEA